MCPLIVSILALALFALLVQLGLLGGLLGLADRLALFRDN